LSVKDSVIIQTAMDYKEAALLFNTASNKLSSGCNFVRTPERIDADNKEIFKIVLQGIGKLDGIQEPSLRQFAQNCVFEQTLKDDLNFLPYLIWFQINNDEISEAIELLRMIAYRLATEGCGREPFETLLRINTLTFAKDHLNDDLEEELRNAEENLECCIGTKATHNRVSGSSLEKAWLEYQEQK